MDVDKLRDTLGQMTMLSLTTDRSYRISVREFGEFHVNWSNKGDGIDVIWQWAKGVMVRVSSYDIEERMLDYLDWRRQKELDETHPPEDAAARGIA